MKHLLELVLYKKRAELYSRALWGKGFVVRGVAVDDVDATPHSYVANKQIYLPERVHVRNEYLRYYRAAMSHAALHVISNDGAFDRENLNLMQRTVVGLVEDLRLELHAIKYFPGLRDLWLGFHDVEESKLISASRLMLRLSRSVLDPMYQDDHQWVRKGKKNILEKVCHHSDPKISLEVGLGLANDLGQMRLPMNTGKYEQPVAYRDDNSCLWEETQEHRQKSESSVQLDQFTTKNSKFIEVNHGIDLHISETNLFQHGRGFELKPDSGDDIEYQQTKSPEKGLSSRCPEWDYRSQVLKQDWCRIREYTGNPGSMTVIEEITDRHKYILKRLRRMANRLSVDKLQWKRKVEDGDDFELMSVIDAVVSVRGNMVPDTRVFMRKAQYREKNLAISILLDLSESTNDLVEGGVESVSQVVRDAVYLLAETLSVVGDRFSVAGFSSDGRHQVNYVRFKTFEENYELTKGRISSVTGKYSTRLGAAIRHCARELSQQFERKKLLLVITDGSPSDVDVYDKNYLIQDSWHAVRSLARVGIRPFCINLDSNADKIIEHIFGFGRAETLAHVARLPDLLEHLYLRYMRTG